ncbi:MAG: hypothetical protein JWO06_3776, partial [Bacteroidota bacterium]|nr:hypothetical protein [Bacteroidota bacterium]
MNKTEKIDRNKFNLSTNCESISKRTHQGNSKAFSEGYLTESEKKLICIDQAYQNYHLTYIKFRSYKFRIE